MLRLRAHRLLIAAALLIIVKHHENIGRLLAGKENRLDLKKKA